MQSPKKSFHPSFSPTKISTKVSLQEKAGRFIQSRASPKLESSPSNLKSPENAPPSAVFSSLLLNSLFGKTSPPLAARPSKYSPPLTPLLELFCPSVATPRSLPKSPYKILDAPQLRDDFYVDLVDWSSSNILAVGLGKSAYL